MKVFWAFGVLVAASASVTEEAAEDSNKPGWVAWPDSETWLIPIPQCEELELEESCKARKELGVDRFCKEMELEDATCDGVKRISTAEGLDEVAGSENQMDRWFQSLSLQYNLLMNISLVQNQERRELSVPVPIAGDIDSLASEFCKAQFIKDDACDGLVAQMKAAREKKRTLVRNSIAWRMTRVEEAVVSLDEGIPEHTAFELVHNLFWLLKIKPNDWRTLFLQARFLSFCAGKPRIADFIGLENGSGLIMKARALFGKSLQMIRISEEFKNATAMMTLEQSSILQAIGQLEFEMGKIVDAETVLSATFSTIFSLYQESPSKALFTRMHNILAQMIEHECNKSQRNTTTIYPLLDNFEKLHAETFSLEAFQLQLALNLCVPRVSMTVAMANSVARDIRDSLSQLEVSLLVRLPSGEKTHDLQTKGVAFGLQANWGSFSPDLTRSLIEYIVRLQGNLIPSSKYVSPYLERKTLQSLPVRPRSKLQHLGIVSSSLSEERDICFVLLQILDSKYEDLRISVIHLGEKRSVRRLSSGPCREFWEKVTTRHGVAVYEIELDHEPNERTDSALQFLSTLRLDMILFLDLGLSESSFALAFARLAPAQLSFWGPPIVGGLKETIDYYILPRTAVTNPSFSPLETSQSSGVPLCSANLAGVLGVGFENLLVLCPDFHLYQTASISGQHLREEVIRARKLVSLKMEVSNLSITIDDSRIYFVPYDPSQLVVEMDSVYFDIAAKDPDAVFLFLRKPSENKQGFSAFRNDVATFETRIKAAKNDIRIIFIELNEGGPTLEAFGQLASVVLENFGSTAYTLSTEQLLLSGVPSIVFPAKKAGFPGIYSYYVELAVLHGKDWVASQLACTDPSDLNCVARKAVDYATNEELQSEWRSLLLAEETKRYFTSHEPAKKLLNLLRAVHSNVTHSWGFNTRLSDEDFEGCDAKLFAETKSIVFDAQNGSKRTTVESKFVSSRATLASRILRTPLLP